MYKKYISAVAIIAASSLFASAEAKEEKIGIVNFASCVTDSKFGKQEQEAFESVKVQMTSLMEDTEKQLTEVATNLKNPDYMDGLSPEGEQELKAKYQSLQEEMARYQQQYYQLVNQANYKLIQSINAHIQSAAQKIAQKRNLDYVINKDAVFFYNSDLDITSDVIHQMNEEFEQSKQAENAAAQNEQAGQKG